MKSKKSSKVFQIIFLIMLFIAAMALGALSGAYYKSTRKGEGTVVFNKGLYYSIYNLSVDSSGTTIAEGSILYYTDGTTAKNYAGFKNISIGQLETYQIATPFLKTQSNTLPFYVRAKLDYVMYTESSGTYTKITNSQAITSLRTALFTNGTDLEFDSANWNKNAGGWYYYVDSSKNLKIVDGSTTSDIKLFTSTTAADGNYYSTLKTGEWDSLTGGPEVTIDGTTYKLARLDINLTVESLQKEGVDIWNYNAAASGNNIIVDNVDNIIKDSSGNQIETTSDLVSGQTYTLTNPEGNGFTFVYYLDENNKTARITGYTGTPTELIIPDSIYVNNKEYKVTRINNEAFKNCTSLTSVVIGNNVNHIGLRAFYGTYLETTTAAGDFIYADCENGLRWLLTYKTTAPTGKLNIPEDVVGIAYQAFYMCTDLSDELRIPDSVKYINQQAFCWINQNYIDLYIGDGVEIIGTSAFNNTTFRLQKMGANVRKIETSAFNQCEGRYWNENLVFPDTLIEIGDNAFKDSGIVNFVVPKNITKLGVGLFQSCDRLKSITFHENITEIGKWCFTGCSSLSGEITLPSKITYVGEQLFQGCTGITKVILGDKITSIDKQAFNGCSSLTELVINTTTPPTIGLSAFYNAKITTVYVPAASVNSYKAATGWKDFDIQPIA